MGNKSKETAFSTMEEYRSFYESSRKEAQGKGSKYYRLGTHIARMACDEAVQEFQKRPPRS